MSCGGAMQLRGCMMRLCMSEGPEKAQLLQTRLAGQCSRRSCSPVAHAAAHVPPTAAAVCQLLLHAHIRLQEVYRAVVCLAALQAELRGKQSCMAAGEQACTSSICHACCQLIAGRAISTTHSFMF